MDDSRKHCDRDLDGQADHQHVIKIKGQNKEKPDVEDDAEKDWMKLNDVIEEPVLADGCHYQSYSE